MAMISSAEKNRRLRELIARPGAILSFSAYDVFSALLLEQAGFEMLFAGGFGAAASLYGLPDLNFLSMSEMADQARRMTSRLSIPLIVDADTGYGELHHVGRTVQLLEQAGASGLHLEDQLFPKRCGHFGGKQVIPADEMKLKIEAAVKARTDPNFLIIARTDARQPLGLEEAIQRVNLYCSAGADAAFVEAPQSKEELALIPRRVPYPLLANMLVGGKTPILSAQELSQMGYKFVVSPIETLAAAGQAVRALAQEFKTKGRLDHLDGRLMHFDEVKSALGVEQWLEFKN